MQRTQIEALADVQRADALGSVNLVRAHRIEIAAARADVHRNLARRLHAVRMHRYARRARDGRDFFDGLDHAQLVIDVHDADQRRIRPDGAAHGLRIDQAAMVDGNKSHRGQLRTGL